MKNYWLALLFQVSFLLVGAQQAQQDYDGFKKQAETLYQQKEYRSSALKYSEAFASIGDKGTIDDRYNAACSWAMANEPDSAFYHLNRIAASGHFTNLDHLRQDTDLQSLYQDKRWPEVLALVKKYKDEKEKDYDKPLVAKLDSIFEQDQRIRWQADSVYKQFGSDAPEFKALAEKFKTVDSLNLVAVREILDTKGWLGPTVVGEKGTQTLFLVIQHADLKTQQKYLPLLQEAVVKKELDPANFALLKDRIDLREGRKQTYGSQIFRDPQTKEQFVAPLIDPDHVDERRKEVGLQPMAEYVQFFDFTWDLEAYKKNLPHYERIHEEMVQKEKRNTP
ncbi:hypothetical protein GCM10023231_18650 [Olivibacter ginsenosidimutans]|uniref:Tetratricopeptide repeat protein n=1 Tax=Olivibacter ginsenosidimutans TaxID=1176537 RepID=A0ABP9B5Q8_9SPHI